MKLPPALEKAATRFNALSLRERGFIAGGLLAALITVWDSMSMAPLRTKEHALTKELNTIQGQMSALAGSLADGTDPTTLALEQERALKQSLAAANEALASTSSGLIAAEHMVQVIEDVLSKQDGLRLVELRNKPVVGLMALASNGDTAAALLKDAAAAAKATAQSAAAVEQGPYVHPIELTIEGRYIDVLNYLRQLEALPWRMYWQVLELQAREYPTSRVRIQVNTISMDKAWLGV